MVNQQIMGSLKERCQVFSSLLGAFGTQFVQSLTYPFSRGNSHKHQDGKRRNLPDLPQKWKTSL